jgi:hypothetical protein
VALNKYQPGTSFSGVMGRTGAESEPAWPEPNRAAEGAPNVLFVVLDDTGFAHLGAYGSSISTPNMDRLAANGLTYTNMHTTALCSPTRSCILTGRAVSTGHPRWSPTTTCRRTPSPARSTRSPSRYPAS